MRLKRDLTGVTGYREEDVGVDERLPREEIEICLPSEMTLDG